MKTNNAVIITDPCYLLNGEDWEKSDYGEDLDIFFPNSICRDTIYGDWTCGMYKVTYSTHKDIEDVLDSHLTEIGTFTADAGMVCVVDVGDVCKYGPRVFNECITQCYTIIPGFKNKNITWSFETDRNDELHVIGRDEKNFIRYISNQTGA